MFELTPSEKEAIYMSLINIARDEPGEETRTYHLMQDLKSLSSHVIFTVDQLGMVLRGLERASREPVICEHYTFKEVRHSLAAKSRTQHRLIC